MKKLFAFFIALLCYFITWAQSPEKMSYQAVIRNSSGELITNQEVGMQISLLQGDVDGAIVYAETHSSTTGTNGLVSLEIGNGAAVSGSFTAIDWSEGPYFIKTETDLTGSSNYTITGTSQLLSVPYALHAKTADSLRGGIEEIDPAFQTSLAYGITESDTSQWNNKQNQLIAGNGIEIKGNVISVKSSLAIGDSYQGGIIFWLDDTGHHGLIAAKEDHHITVLWSAVHRTTGITGDGVYAGKTNTSLIVASEMADNPSGNFAAKICANYAVTEDGITYGDWYLPSQYELKLLMSKASLVGGFISNLYWSSTEKVSVNAWVFRPYGGVNQLNKTWTASVRAIRAF